MVQADEDGELNKLPAGVSVKAEKNGDIQKFKAHFLCLNAASLAVMYDPSFNMSEFR